MKHPAALACAILLAAGVWTCALGDEDARLSHWAYQAVREAGAPGGAGAHPVDAFVSQGLRGVGLRMSPEADRRTLIRSLYFALHGLAATPEEVERFAGDADPQA